MPPKASWLKASGSRSLGASGACSRNVTASACKVSKLAAAIRSSSSLCGNATNWWNELEVASSYLHSLEMGLEAAVWQ